MRRADMTARPAGPQLQALFAVQAVKPLVVDRPSLAPEQHMNALVTVADAHLCNLLDTTLQRILRRPSGPVPLNRSRLANHQTCPTLADPVVAAQIRYRFATL